MGLSNRIVSLNCECPAAVAAARFSQRKRHPGHLDTTRTCEQILTNIEDLARFKLVEIGERVSVDTSAKIELAVLVSKISEQVHACTSRRGLATCILGRLESCLTLGLYLE